MASHFSQCLALMSKLTAKELETIRTAADSLILVEQAKLDILMSTKVKVQVRRPRYKKKKGIKPQRKIVEAKSRLSMPLDELIAIEKDRGTWDYRLDDEDARLARKSRFGQVSAGVAPPRPERLPLGGISPRRDSEGESDDD